MSEYHFSPSKDYQEKEQEAKAICKDISTAQNIIYDGIARYKKKQLKARSKKAAEDTSIFDVLNDYPCKESIRDDYGWELITAAEMNRRMHLWDMRELYVDKSGRYNDRVTEMLSRAAAHCAEEFIEILNEFESMQRQLHDDLKRIEQENRENSYKRYIEGL